MARIDLSALTSADREWLKARQRERIRDGVPEVRPASPARRAKVRARMQGSATDRNRSAGPLDELATFLQIVSDVERAWPF